jgi:hypothetical protein
MDAVVPDEPWDKPVLGVVVMSASVPVLAAVVATVNVTAAPSTRTSMVFPIWLLRATAVGEAVVAW